MIRWIMVRSWNISQHKIEDNDDGKKKDLQKMGFVIVRLEQHRKQDDDQPTRKQDLPHELRQRRIDIRDADDPGLCKLIDARDHGPVPDLLILRVRPDRIDHIPHLIVFILRHLARRIMFHGRELIIHHGIDIVDHGAPDLLTRGGIRKCVTRPVEVKDLRRLFLYPVASVLILLPDNDDNERQ